MEEIVKVVLNKIAITIVKATIKPTKQLLSLSANVFDITPAGISLCGGVSLDA